MPERRPATYRVATLEVQGADSWIELRKIDYGTRKRYREGELDALEVLSMHLVAWNWVDSDGEPLPQPGDVGYLPLWDDEASAILIAIFRGPDGDESPN